MPQPKRQILEPDAALVAPAAPPATTLVSLNGEIDWAASPARAMHEQLLRAFAADVRPAPGGLTLRAKFAIVAGASLCLWSLIGLTIVALV